MSVRELYNRLVSRLFPWKWRQFGHVVITLSLPTCMTVCAYVWVWLLEICVMPGFMAHHHNYFRFKVQPTHDQSATHLKIQKHTFGWDSHSWNSHQWRINFWEPGIEFFSAYFSSFQIIDYDLSHWWGNGITNYCIQFEPKLQPHMFLKLHDSFGYLVEREAHLLIMMTYSS